jgi:hypothetical protein
VYGTKDPDLLRYGTADGKIRTSSKRDTSGSMSLCTGTRDELIIDYEVRVARHNAVMAGTVEPTDDEMIGKILHDEIQAEINREVIRKINGG